MAIDLFCYSSLSAQEAQKVIDLMKLQHKGLFDSRFLIFEAREASQVHKEIALEYDVAANSTFLVSLSDKSVADLVPTVLILIKSAFGASNVVILSDGESLR
jgi:hypothetical protein